MDLIDPKEDLKLNFKTKLINKNKSFSVDVIPTEYHNLPLLSDSVVNLRLDKGEIKEEAFYQYCSNHKCIITTENIALSPDVFKNFHENIQALHIILDSKIDQIPQNYFDLCKRLNIDVKIQVKNKDILDQTRFDYFDQNVEYLNPPTEKPEKVNLDDKFFSFKLVVEGDKVYKSTYHWKNNIDNSDNIVDNPNYWEELDYFYIYEQDRY